MREREREGKGGTFDRREDALHGAQEDRPALVFPEPRREAADVREGGDGVHPPLESGQDEELHPQDGCAVELVRVHPELRQPRRVLLLHLDRQRQARHREQLQSPLLPSLNPSSSQTAAVRSQSYIIGRKRGQQWRRQWENAGLLVGSYIDSPLREEAIEVSDRDVGGLPAAPERRRGLRAAKKQEMNIGKNRIWGDEEGRAPARTTLMIQRTHPERAAFIHSSISSAGAPPLPDALSSDRSSATYSSSWSTTSRRSSRATTRSAPSPSSSASARKPPPSSRQMRMDVGVSGADVEAAAAAASPMASIRARACAGKRERKVKEKIFGRPVGGEQQGGGKGGVRSAGGCARARARRGTLERKGGFPPSSPVSATLARVHRGTRGGAEMSSWRGRDMGGGAVRVCVECGGGVPAWCWCGLRGRERGTAEGRKGEGEENRRPRPRVFQQKPKKI